MGVRHGEEGVPPWLAAAWAFFCFKSVLHHEGSRGLASLPHETGPNPALPSTAPQRSLQGQVPTPNLKVLLSPSATPISPASHQTPGCHVQASRGCGSPGLVLEGRVQCEVPSSLGSWHTAFLYVLCRTGIRAPMSLSDVCGP